jgi:hypothetical protein
VLAPDLSSATLSLDALVSLAIDKAARVTARKQQPHRFRLLLILALVAASASSTVPALASIRT